MTIPSASATGLNGLPPRAGTRLRVPEGAPSGMRQAFREVEARLPELRDGFRRKPEEAGEGVDFSREMKQMFVHVASNLPAVPETAEEARALTLNVAAGLGMAGALDGVIAYVAGHTPHALPPGDPLSDSLNQSAQSGIDAARREVLEQGAVECRRKVEQGIDQLDQGLEALVEQFPGLGREEYRRALAQASVMAYATGVRLAALACVEPHP